MSRQTPLSCTFGHGQFGGRIIVSISSLMSAGCYEAELDPNLYGVYVCDQDSDCALGSTCVEGVCEADPNGGTGPTIRVTDPPQLEIFPSDQQTRIPLIVTGQNLELTASDGSDAATNAGYVEILLDGAVVETI